MSEPAPGRSVPDRDAVPRAGALYQFAASTAFAVMRAQGWRFEVRGLEHVPRRGGAVLTANHTSFWDFFTVGWAPLRRLGRPIRILAKASLFRTPVFGQVLANTGQIPVHRGAGRQAFASAIEALRRGELVLVLPEQTISPSFDLLPYKSGAARMAALAGVPLVPAMSWGSHRFHTTGRRPSWSWRLPVTISYGEPLHPTREDKAGQVTDELWRRTFDLLDDAQRSYPDGTPADAWWVPARLGGGAMSNDEAHHHLERLTKSWPARARDRRPAAEDQRRPSDRPGDDEPS